MLPVISAAAAALRRELIRTGVGGALSTRRRGCSLCGCMAGGCVVSVLAVVVAAGAAGLSLATIPQITAGAGETAPETCAGLYASQGFGDTPWERPHTGIDIVCPSGTAVVATLRGTFHRRSGIALACRYPAGKSGGLGVFGEIDAGSLRVLYGHLEAFAEADSTAVEPGTVIGFEGSTGCATGPHLHFEVDLGGEPVNPCPYLPAGYPAAHQENDLRCWGSAPP